MLVLRIAALLDVPVLDRADDVDLVGGAQLDLDLVASVRLGVRQEQVEPARSGLAPLHVLHF